MGDWIAAVSEIAAARWKEKRPLLLAQLPGALKEKNIDPAEVIQGRRLKNALEIDGHGRIRVFQNPDKPLEWAVLPASIEDNPFSSVEPAPSDSEPNVERLPRPFWSAFLVPLVEGSRRYLFPHRKFHFQDLKEGDPHPVNSIEVERTYLPAFTEPYHPSPATISAGIRRWANAHDFNLEPLYLSSQPQPPPKTDHQLADVLQALAPEDLARIMVPIDIVLKMMKKD
jgi:hypothetical protein